MTTTSEPTAPSGRRWLFATALPMALIFSACTPGGQELPEEFPPSSPAVAPAEPAAFVFRGDLCDRVDWSGFEGYGSIEPTEDDVAYYEEPMGRMECVRYFTRPGKRTNGDALTIRLKLGVSGDLAAEIERLRTEQSWSPVERSSWDGCVHRESEFDLEYTCTTDNLLVAFSSDTVIIEPDAAYTDAIFAFLDDVRALTKA